jgi:hypothetical protein
VFCTERACNPVFPIMSACFSMLLFTASNLGIWDCTSMK